MVLGLGVLKSPPQATSARRALLISVSVAHSQTPSYATRPRIYRASASPGVPVYAPAFAGTKYCLVAGTCRWVGPSPITDELAQSRYAATP